MSETQTHRFEAEVSQVMSLVINSLYSNKEIFLRELISNASDALDKVRFRAITEPDLLGDDAYLRVRVIPDEAAHTLTIEDNGIGMTEEELRQNLGTIAHSGSRAFVESLKQAAEAARGGDLSLIGQFGVGFYSAFLVADRVEVITRSVDSAQAWRWTSDASDTYTIEPAERAQRGTEIILHLKRDDEDVEPFLTGWRLKDIIKRYSDYVDHSIEMPVAYEIDDEDNPVEDAQTEGFEQINQASALWRRSPEDLSKEEYEEFYRHLTYDWEEPLAYEHFRLEGGSQFVGLLYIPSRPPVDLMDVEGKHGLRLYVKRVFIMENSSELLPQWLRFMRGVIDSDDLPLNVSRETLQDSRAVKAIERQVVKKSLRLLSNLATERPEDYEKCWRHFGRVLKEGLHFAPKHRGELAELMRYESSAADGLTSLAQYVERMPEDQKAIYYAFNADRRLLENSPHLEVLKKRGYEILYMTDNIDQWAVEGLGDYNDLPLVSAMDEDLKLDETDSEREAREAEREALKPLTDRFQEILASHVREVRVSDRLEDSPVCLTVPEGGLHAHIERLLQERGQQLPSSRRILEINPKHTLIQHIQKLQDREDQASQVSEWVELLYDQALITEGSPIGDPNTFAQRMTRMMERAAFASMVEG